MDPVRTSKQRSMTDKRDAGDTVGVVLAGGDSTRFGGSNDNKAIATLNGDTFIERIAVTVDTLSQNPPTVAVRNGEQRDEIDRFLNRRVRYVYDEPSFSGPVGGLFAAAEKADARWLFVCACDMPLISREAVSWLFGKLRESNENSLPDALVVLDEEGKPEPLHSIYRREALLELKETSANGGQNLENLRGLIEPLPEVDTVEVTKSPDNIDLKDSIYNVNTVEDLQKIS